MKKTNSTSTVFNDTEIVPWLASRGPLAYSPECPPDRDYYFQYSWIVPDIFNNKINKREHRYFGYPFKDHYEVKDLLNFWNNCRKGIVDRVFSPTGHMSNDSITAPIAIYSHDNKDIIIQHGSYQFVENKKQPDLKDGIVYLYRGIGKDTVYTHYQILDKDLNKSIMDIHAKTFVDSVVSFNTVHSNVKRCESSALNHDTFILHHLTKELNLQHEDEMISVLNSGYSLNYNYGCSKFGPNHVVFKTPLSNIRITTFFCGEDEVKIIDPNKLEAIKEVGCKVKKVIL